tara:strand:+ start:1440 stop:2039 length:600 start_codon:yes stop_codon:yes gene_type:complete
MKTYGYFRISHAASQDEERQVVALKEAGALVIRGDKITGTSDFSERPELTKLLEEMEDGSLLIISELSRLSRSFIGMVNEVSKLLERNIQIKTLDKRLDTTAMPKEITMLLVSILGYAASQELSALKSRCAEGRSIARNRGVKFGAKRKFNKYQVAEIMDKRKQGLSYGLIGKALGINKSTVQMIIQREQGAVGIGGGA